MDANRSFNTVIVIANNDEKILQTVSTALEKAGFTVLTAQSGAAAANLCRDRAPVHLAIIDTTAAKTDAAGLIRQLRELRPEMRVLLLSDEDQPESVLGTLSRVDRPMVLRKPFRRAQFLGKVLEMTEEPMALTA